MRGFVFLAPLVLAACASTPPKQIRDNAIPRTYFSGDALMFVGLDANGDLSISRAEAESGAKAQFSQLQAKAGGPIRTLALSEWAKTTLGEANFDAERLSFDPNLDGEITEKEFVDRIIALHRFYDRNSDGAVTRMEMAREFRAPPVERGPNEIGLRGPGPRNLAPKS